MAPPVNHVSEFEISGLPVEIGRIDKELARLWESTADAKTRASLINFAVVTDSRRTTIETTELIAAIAAEHACRALLVLLEPQAPEAEPRAWISAHCFPVGKSGKEICSEQITFHLPGAGPESLPGLVFPHLDSDLPLVLWWRMAPPETADPALWRWVDRLLFDSADWVENRAACLQRMLAIAPCAESESQARRPALCDLNWARLLDARFAFASLFDPAAARAELPRISEVSLHYSRGNRTAALLFLGWIAAHLMWSVEKTQENQPGIRPPGGEAINCEFIEEDAPGALLECTLNSKTASFRMRREHDAAHFVLETTFSGGGHELRTFRADSTSLHQTLINELSRSGGHPGYFQTVRLVGGLL